jgi:HlyD family secretion protein
MDIPKASTRRKLPLFRVAAVLLVLASFSFAYARFNSFTNTEFVARDSLVLSTVTQGAFERRIRAPGRLVPDELRWIAATSNARVEEIILHPGDTVTPDSIVMTLSNPDVEEAMDSLKLELEVLEAEFQALEKRLSNNELTQEAVVADVQSQYELADFRKSANLKLSADSAVSEITLNEAILNEKALKTRYEIEQRRLDSLTELHAAELSAKRARINQVRRSLQLQEQLFDELSVRAEFAGNLQDIPVEQGQQLSKGTIVARVANSQDLKAELRVQESQVKDVQPGQTVTISAGGNSAQGVVGRVEPEVQDGVVIVDVYFEDKMLAGARFDLRVDGLVLLERLDDVLSIRRPVFSQENITLPLFVVDPTNNIATRRQVRVGKASTDTLQILEGLDVGEQIIVSDTSQYNELEQFTLR